MRRGGVLSGATGIGIGTARTAGTVGVVGCLITTDRHVVCLWKDGMRADGRTDSPGEDEKEYGSGTKYGWMRRDYIAEYGKAWSGEEDGIRERACTRRRSRVGVQKQEAARACGWSFRVVFNNNNNNKKFIVEVDLACRYTSTSGGIFWIERGESFG